MKAISNKKELSPKQREELLKALKARFEKNLNRHKGLEWAKVQAKLEANPEKLWSLNEMERTGGEPDVVGQDKKSGEFVFMDSSAQSPKGRVSFCYDREALDSRKEHKPKNCVMDLTWPVVTVFGFIAQPDQHIFLKPNVTRVAAKEYEFDFQYVSRPNWTTYSNFLEFGESVRNDLGDLQPHDLIDVQSFLWVLGSDEYAE
jgi:hypothetical protein